MFWPDVIALKEFYGTPLGQIACRTIRQHIHHFWPRVKDDSIVGIGFAPPYLLPWLEEAHSTLACMPATQGVIHWPAQLRNLSLLSDEAELPFADNSIQRVLVVHALENSDQARQMMAELWRILSPAGRILIVVPNRRGIWARAPHSPFAYGQPFTSWQLRQLLTEHSFTPLGGETALFFPPSNWRYMRRFIPFLETLGRYLYPGFGGVLLMEAEKRIYAPATQKVWRHARKTYGMVAQPSTM